MEKNMLDSAKVYQKGGAIYSIEPAEAMFGFTCHAHMIPHYKPDSVLMLGYAMGTVPNLIRKIWGADVKFTGVDIERYPSSYVEYKMVYMDALDYLRDCADHDIVRRYDCVIVDLYDGPYLVDYVLESGFVNRLKKIARRSVVVNTPISSVNNIKAYYDAFDFGRHVNIEGQTVIHWLVREQDA